MVALLTKILGWAADKYLKSFVTQMAIKWKKKADAQAQMERTAKALEQSREAKDPKKFLDSLGRK